MNCELDEFYSKFGLSQSEFHKKYMPKQYNGELFHYTSLSAFESILTGDPNMITLWASRYDCLNDTSEGKLVTEVYKNVCKKLKKDNQIPNDMTIDLEKIVPARTMLFKSKVDNKIKITRPESIGYVCSFSKDQNSIPMWKCYSKDDMSKGLNIGFSVDKIKKSLSDFYSDMEVNIQVYPVIYDRTVQEDLIENFVKQVINKYSSDYEFSIRYVISNQLTIWKLIFKHKSFEYENEVRIIVNIAKQSSNKKSNIDVKSRKKGQYKIPYIEIKLDKSVMTSAMAGPLLNENDIIKAQNIISNNEYEADLLFSKLPLRYL